MNTEILKEKYTDVFKLLGKHKKIRWTDEWVEGWTGRYVKKQDSKMLIVKYR